VKDILPAIEKAKKMKKSLVVFAEDISEGVSSMLYYNHLKKIIECCPVRVPERGSNSALYLPQIAKVTNAHLFS
jgi:chaperonin GroEL